MHGPLNVKYTTHYLPMNMAKHPRRFETSAPV